MGRIAGKIMMIARRASKVVAILRCRGVRHSERMIFSQPFGAMVLQMSCGVELVVKGPTIHCLTRAFHPQNTVCSHVGFNQRFLCMVGSGNIAMSWFYLAAAIMAKVIATSLLKSSKGFARLWPSLIVIAGYGCLSSSFTHFVNHSGWRCLRNLIGSGDCSGHPDCLAGLRSENRSAGLDPHWVGHVRCDCSESVFKNQRALTALVFSK